MKNKRRWLAGLLALALVVNLFVGSTWADEKNGTVAKAQTEQSMTETDMSNEITDESNPEVLDENTDAENSEEENNTEDATDQTEEADEKLSKQEEVQVFSDSTAEENAVYVGTTIINDEESATMGKDWLHALSSWEDAFNQVSNGGTIYVVGSVTIDRWPQIAKDVTVSAFYSEKPEELADKYVENYNNAVQSKILIAGDIVLSGNTVFTGWNYTDSSNMKKLYITNADGIKHEIYPEGHKLQIGSIDKNGSVYDDVEIRDYNSQNRGYANFHFCTELYDKSKADNAGVIDLQLYGNNKYFISAYSAHTDTVFYGYTTVNLELIGTDEADYSVNEKKGWGNKKKAYIKSGGIYTSAILPSLSDETQSVNIEFRNFQTEGGIELHTEKGKKPEYLSPVDYTEQQSYTHGYITNSFGVGSYFTTKSVAINFTDIYLPSILKQNIWHSVCDHLTYTFKNTFITRIRGQWTNAGFAEQMSNGILTVNMEDSKIEEEAYLYTNDTNTNDPYTVIINASGNSSIGGAIQTRNSDSLLIHVKENSSFNFISSDFKPDITIEKNGTIAFGNGEANCNKLTGQEGACILLQPKSQLRIKDKISGNLGIKIDGVTGVQGAGANTAVNCSWSAGSVEAGTTVSYAGKPSDEKITAVTKEDSGRYYSADQDVFVEDPNAIYVKDAGSDTNDGFSYWDAVSTLSKAYELAVENDRSKIIVCGKVSYGNDVSNYDGDVWNLFASERKSNNMITVTSVATAEDGKTYKFADGYIQLLSVSTLFLNPKYCKVNRLCQKLKFEDISLSSDTNVAYIVANGNKLEIGDGVTTPRATALYGGGLSEDVNSTDVTVSSGTYGVISGGCLKTKDYFPTINGDVSVVVKGGTFTTASSGVSTSDVQYVSSIVGSGPGHVKGNITVKVDGAETGGIEGLMQIAGLSCYNNNGTSYIRDNVTVEGSVSVSVGKNAKFANSILNAVIGVSGGKADNVEVDVSGCDSEYGCAVMAYCGYDAYSCGAEQSKNGEAKIHISDSPNIYGVYGNSNIVSNTTGKLEGSLEIDIENSTVGNIYLGDGDFTNSGSSGNARKSDRTVFSKADVHMKDSEFVSLNGLNFGVEKSRADGNRTVELTGDCTAQGTITAVNQLKVGSAQETGTLSIGGDTIRADKITFTGVTALFQKDCRIEGDYVAEDNVNLIIDGNGTITFDGKITGSSYFKPANAINSATIKSTNYTEDTVPKQKNAFQGDDIQFSQEETTALWHIEGKDPREKRSVIYVRDALENEDTLESNADEYLKVHDGSSYEKAVHDMDEAYRLLDTSSGNAVVVICGKLSMKNSYIVPECEGTVLWTSLYDNEDYREQSDNPAYVYLSGKASAYVGLMSNLTIQNLNLCYESTSFVGLDANGHELRIGTDIGTDVVSVQTEDVKITPAVNEKMGTGKPTSFYIVGAGIYSKNVENIHVELYNTTVGGIITMYGGGVTVGSEMNPADVEIKVRDTDIVQKKYYIGADENGSIYDNTVYGNVTMSEELYSRNLDFREITNGKQTDVTDSATRNYINKTNVRKGLSWDTFYLFVNAAKKTTILVDGKDDRTKGFSTTYMMPLSGTLCNSEFTEIILLGGINIDKQYWNWEDNIQNENNSLRLQLGNAERGSYATLNEFLSDNSDRTSKRVRKSIRVDIYPGTMIGNSQANVVKADNYTTDNRYKWPVCTLDEGYPMLVFHSSTADPDAEYHLTQLRDFSVEADGCSVVNDDAESVVSSISLKNGGTYEESFNTSNEITLKKTKLADTDRIVGGGNLYISGEESHFVGISGFSTEGNCTIENASLDIDGENRFASLTGIGNASFNAEPGTTIIADTVSADDTILVNCSSDEAPTAENGELSINVTVNQADVAETLFSAGTTASGAQISPLKVKKDSNTITWTMGPEEAEGDKIFLSGSNGDDANSGGDSSHAVKTIDRAFALAQEKYEEQKNPDIIPVYHVIVCGTVDWAQDITGFDPDGYRVVIEPMSKRYQKINISDSISIPASVSMRNFVFIGSEALSSPSAVYAEGHNLTISTGNDTTGYVSIYGGCASETLNSEKGYTLTVESGKWYRVFGAGKNQPTKISDPNGKITVNIGNAEIKSAPTVCSQQDQDQGMQVYGIFGGGEEPTAQVNGNTEVNILYGDQYSNVYGAGWNAAQTGNTKVQISGNPVIRRIYGASYQAALIGNTEISIESGTINRIYGGGSVEDRATVTGNTKVILGTGDSNSEDQKTVVKDYIRGSGDRAGVTGTSELLIQGGADIQDGCSVSAGGYKGGVDKSILTVTGGTVNCDIYAGGAGAYKSGTTVVDTTLGIVNNSEINITGGIINGNAFAGGNMGYVGNGTSVNQTLSTVNITGGTVTGSIYGGCNIATTYGNTDVTFAGGTVEGNVFGGGKGTDSIAAEITGTAKVIVDSKGVAGSIYGGCDTNGSVQNTEVTSNVLPGCNLFAGGYGEKTTVFQKAVLSLNASDITQNNKYSAYGGGEKGTVNETEVNVTNWNGDIFGGGKGELKTKNRIARALLRIFTSSDLIDANVQSTNVVINGTVNGDVFGGGEFATVGTADESASENDLATVVSNVTVNGTVNGKVYGGGKGESGKDYAAINGSTQVILGTGGNVTVAGNAENATTGVVFGGGQNAPVAGNTNVTVNDGIYSTIFGGNDASGEIQGTTNVSVTGGQTDHVYGAGREATYSGSGASVLVNTAVQNTSGVDASANVSEVYGGGYGEGAVTDKTSVEIQSGRVTTAYAGGNAAETRDTEISVTGGKVTTIFGGGNAATVTGSSTVEVNTTDDEQHVDTVFAGNNKASMAIKPTLNFEDGKIGTVYCGGNQGVMTYTSDNGGMAYDFDYPDIKIGTVFAGCNNTTEQTSDVKLTLVSGTYDTVYGGNNQNGNMEQTNVVVNASSDSAKPLDITTVYGGGNQADAVNTSVAVKNGKVSAVYGGGNAATVTDSAKISTGDSKSNASADTSTASAVITDLYCGNNEAEMNICPEIDLKAAHITSFYGGGNKGAMTSENGLDYTFDAADLTIDTIYGGGNEAGVTNAVTLNVNSGNYTNVYGGSNSKGTVDKTNVYINGDVGSSTNNTLTGKIFGGGRGSETTVNTTNVYLQNGTIAGNVYGGSGFGKVGSATVTVKEADASNDSNASAAKVQVLGNVFGAGFGVSSSAEETNVNVDLKLNIVDANGNADSSNGDVHVKENLKDVADNSGESFATAKWLNNKNYTDGSYIAGNVFGGGDMGQVGQGYINVSTNTAVIEQGGITNISVSGGYIHGNVFGGGNGQPGGTDEADNAITEYTVYMGTVFGTSNVDMTGGYVNGNVFGCGQQSRTYAAESKTDDDASDAAIVTISTEKSQKPVLIGGSIFGGGNKGNGTTQNASVATTYGDTHVTLKGNEGKYTPIYLLSNGTSGGGVYGDGNLCLVSGKKYVTLENFSCGVGKDVTMLKTFYSLQRADVVDLTGSRIVLKGAVDLVAENADDTQYSINRVGQLNLKESSTIKVTKTVNLLGELTSDEQTERQFIDRGNNDGNALITGNGYKAHGGGAPANPLTQDEVNQYISDYDKYIAGNTVSNRSVNVVCVANGGYLEIKKSATEYGPVTGLFTLQLVNANPGEGGGFVYADIMGKQVKDDKNQDKYITGNFICVTKQSSDSDKYMYAYHNVGGQLSSDGKYEYYVWYLKGNKYSYNVDLTAYIGTTETDFTRTVSLPADPSQSFVLTELKQDKDVSGMDLVNMYQNTWDATSDDDKASNKIAVEVTLVTNEKSGNTIDIKETAIGYLGYQTDDPTDPSANVKKTSDGKLVWGIWKSDGNSGWKFQSCANSDSSNSFKVEAGDALARLDANVVNAQLKFTLHKGTGMTTEFRNLPFEMKIAEINQADYDSAVKGSSYIQEDSCIRLTTNLNLSAIRLVPTQAAYMGSGRMFAGVSSSSTVNITDTSSFTAQFVTKYVPSAFNTGSTNQITETLTTSYSNTYLLDAEGVGYTVEDQADGTVKILNMTNTSDPDVSTYAIVKNSDGTYTISYKDNNGSVMTDSNGDGKQRIYTCTPTTQNSSFTLPKGTVITLLASLDEDNPTYWYYYCTEDTKEVELSKFTEMNTANKNSTGSSNNVYKTISSTSSSRITENMIFVFDFSNVDSSEWKDGSSDVSEWKGHVMLKHTYTNGQYTADIMDYVSSDSKTVEGQTKVSYTKETPKNTDEFKISTTTDGITKFEVKNANDQTDPIYGQKEAMKFELTITPDTTVTNTQYEEREYAVILTLQKKDDTNKDIAFPEGTVFTYKGNKLSAGTRNEYVIVPVQTVGTHEIEIQGQLDGFDADQYQLTAKLYSTSADGYYNSLPINHDEDVTAAAFTVVADPIYALSVKETSDTSADASGKTRVKNHLVTQGDSLNFNVTAKQENTSSNDTDSTPVEVQLYQYEKSKKFYKKTDLGSVLTSVPALSAGADQKWSPAISANAQTGTYRLEFKYHDKVEYWDFIVK